MKRNLFMTNRGAVSSAKEMTTASIGSAGASETPSEFGRWQDVQRIYGIKRGTLYNLIAEGKIKSVVLRRKGNVHGCRLIHLASVSEYLNGLMASQQNQAL